MACVLTSQNAYAEIAPELDVALQPEEVVADVIVMAAGATTGSKPNFTTGAGRDKLTHLSYLRRGD